MNSTSSRRDFLAAGLALPVGQAPGLPPREVRYRTLGKTGLKVSTLGFGCMLTSDSSVLQRAADLGVNFFDTARVYQGGNNERMVGAALKSRRKSLFIVSKTLASNKRGALEDLETSLRELSTDYLDIWHLHDKSSAHEITGELVEAQQQAKQQGKIRFAGVSLHGGHKELIPALIRNGRLDVLLVSYNFAMETNVDSLIQAAHQAGLGVVAMKVMAGSFPYDSSYDRAQSTLRRSGAMRAALKWVLKNTAVHTAIPSMIDRDQLEENFAALSVPFNEADRKLLAAQLERIRPLYCRMCGHCEGACPQGLPVAGLLRYLTYAEGYGQFALGRQHFLGLPATVTQVRCDRCPSCSVRCPNGVQVAARLSRAQELFA